MLGMIWLKHFIAAQLALESKVPRVANTLVIKCEATQDGPRNGCTGIEGCDH